MTNQCNLANQRAFSTTDTEIALESAFALQAKALSHPARVRILKILVTLDNLGGCLNCDLVSQLELAQSTVSEHLRILKQAEFIIAEPNPPKVCYRINRHAIADFEHVFNHLFN
ncbi:winged helix-turn-helix domain-containing protein [Vibrio sp. Isolate25]|uniref:ArsR/SmtB family transcription factor n=1 Tax=Vibrio sp. Isolate25 TaxID=2908535 RepID=UPI001EFE84B0|nr:winged helix-turn-helix domain-containing protein [Vibrio sp. Isolate25]MCG9595892.1 winged helix-turn-helix domain-containing protein [Vibrio sp. Isolate25]